MGNQDVRAIGAGMTPPITYDEDGRPVIDSSAEGEAVGRRYEQTQALAGGRYFEEAKARGTSKEILAPVRFNHDDLLSAAPDQAGDNPTPVDSD